LTSCEVARSVARRCVCTGTPHVVGVCGAGIVRAGIFTHGSFAFGVPCGAVRCGIVRSAAHAIRDLAARRILYEFVMADATQIRKSSTR
jgi:hypothetical protein